MSSPNVQRITNGLIGKTVAIILSLLGISLILWLDRWLIEHGDLPEFSGDINIGLLLLMGHLTGFHCVGMCGPLVFGYTTKIAGSGHKSPTQPIFYTVSVKRLPIP